MSEMAVCKFHGAVLGCTDKQCPLLHLQRSILPRNILCKFLDTTTGCLRKDCPFKHPTDILSSRKRQTKGILGDPPDMSHESQLKRKRGDSKEQIWETILIPNHIVHILNECDGDWLESIKNKCKANIIISKDVNQQCMRELHLGSTKVEIDAVKSILNRHFMELGLEFDPTIPKNLSAKNLYNPANFFAQNWNSSSTVESINNWKMEYNNDRNPDTTTSTYLPRCPINSLSSNSPSNLTMFEKYQPKHVLPDKVGFCQRSQHRVTTVDIQNDNDTIFHLRKFLKVEANEIVTFESFCNEHINCNFAVVRNGVGESGIVPLRHLCPQIEPIECAFCHAIQNQFYTEDEYLIHLCLDHFYKRLSSVLTTREHFICPVEKCRRNCETLKDLIIHYGAIPHAKVISLVFDASGDNVKQLKDDFMKKIVSLQTQLEQARKQSEENQTTTNSIAQLKNANDAVEHLTLKNEEIQKELREKTFRLNDLLKENFQLEKNIKKGAEVASNKDEQLKSKQGEIDLLQKKVQSDSSILDDKCRQLTNLSEELKEIKERYENKEDEIDDFRTQIATKEKSYKEKKREDEL